MGNAEIIGAALREPRRPVTFYLDTSALAKLILDEPESQALRRWLAERGDTPRVTNVVGAVELQRLAARVSQQAVGVAVQLLNRLDLLDLTHAALARAAALPPPTVRSLDALHIASAAQLSDLTALVTYDQRMSGAALDYGVTVVSPGHARV